MIYINIPDDVLFLLQENLKSDIEKQTGAEISIDEETKTVSINHENSVKEMDVKRVLNAIKLGFDIDTSFKLFHSDLMILEEINIRNRTRNDKDFKRQKGRIIGKNGRTKELISELSEVDININKDYVGIIGSMSDVKEARRAVLNLIRGDAHASVYNQLEKYKSKKSNSMLNSKIP